MARDDKSSAVAEIAEAFRSSNGAVLTEYRGLTVKQLKELRRDLGDHATYSIVKNTLTKIAAREAGVDAFDGLLAGPSAIAFIKGDTVEAAKGLRDFAKANPHLVIKGGVLDGRTVSPAEISRMADLESREVLLAKLAGAMKASMSGAAALFAAPLAQAARAFGALAAKAAQDAPAAPVSSPETTTDEAAPVSSPETTTDEAAPVSPPETTTDEAAPESPPETTTPAG